MKANDIKKEYLTFVKENAVFKDLSEGHTEVVTPFVDPFGEAIGFSIKSNGRTLTITEQLPVKWAMK